MFELKALLNAITDRVSTKKGMWITLCVWLLATILLSVLAPSAKDYEVSSIETLPKDAQSVIAQNKVDEYFQNTDSILGILVFQANEGSIELSDFAMVIDKVINKKIDGVNEILPLSILPPQAAASFFSEDQSTALIPINFDSSIETSEIKEAKLQMQDIVNYSSNLTMYLTGPAGIATDTLDLFSRADFVLLFSTVGLILVLLIVIYRSPLLAMIPLIAAGFVYQVVNQIMGFMGQYGLILYKQTLSIMSILLFAAVIDYSLFVFSRFREELKGYENKFDAMKWAMKETGMPVFFSGGTVLAAMLVLFVGQLGDYKNFAPIFATALIVIILASITLVPALFTIFGRKAFWPKKPQVGDKKIATNSVWSNMGRFVAKKPIVSVISISVFLLLAASNMFNLNYEFDTMKSFPEDMPSRQGYEILGEKFEKGDLAPTTVIFESNEEVSKLDQEELRKTLAEQELVSNVRQDGVTEDHKVIKYSMTFEENPYAVKTLDALEKIQDNAQELVAKSNVNGELYFAGETAAKMDDRSINKRDLVYIVLLETILIFGMLIVLTKSIRMPIYMMGTILLSFLATIGLGIFLADLFFNIDSISNRVPLFSFVFLVALGIDYNIILISRFQEEREKHSVKKAVELAVANTGGVISSAGIILATTFAVLMTQPIQILFVFGFIVAVGIIIDTFLIRGILLPALLVLFEKDKSVSQNNEQVS